VFLRDGFFKGRVFRGRFRREGLGGSYCRCEGSEVWGYKVIKVKG